MLFCLELFCFTASPLLTSPCQMLNTRVPCSENNKLQLLRIKETYCKQNYFQLYYNEIIKRTPIHNFMKYLKCPLVHILTDAINSKNDYIFVCSLNYLFKVHTKDSLASKLICLSLIHVCFVTNNIDS